MKTLTIVMILFSGIVFGQRTENRLDVKFIADDYEMISVKLYKSTTDEAQIKVYNKDKSNVIHSELVGDTEYFKKTFDLSKLSGYAYFVTVSNGTYTYERRVILKDNEWSIENFDVRIKERDSGNVEVRIADNPENVESIRILDSSGEEVYKLARVAHLGYRFNLRPLPKDTYRFEISGNGLSVNKAILD